VTDENEAFISASHEVHCLLLNQRAGVSRQCASTLNTFFYSGHVVVAPLAALLAPNGGVGLLVFFALAAIQMALDFAQLVLRLLDSPMLVDDHQPGQHRQHGVAVHQISSTC